MKIYAKEGSSEQANLDDSISKVRAGLGSEYIEMQSERPSDEHICKNGVWVLPEQNEVAESE